MMTMFSGGGTIIVDAGTVFVTLICKKDAVPGLQAYPQPIMSHCLGWGNCMVKCFMDSATSIFEKNDYAFSSRKFGGNAQPITRKRWIHHTSFLWDYNTKNMDYLKLPTRAPKCRSARSHEEFLCQLKEYVPSRSDFIDGTIAALANHFSVQPVELDMICDPCFYTRLLTRQELEQAHSSQCAETIQKAIPEVMALN